MEYSFREIGLAFQGFGPQIPNIGTTLIKGSVSVASGTEDSITMIIVFRGEVVR